MIERDSSDLLTDSEYQQLAEQVFARVELAIDHWLQEDVIDIDTQRTGGLLELSLPDSSKLIINTQPPLQEIWLAARSGGYHFKYVQSRWIDTREGNELFETLSKCASAQANMNLRFTAG